MHQNFYKQQASQYLEQQIQNASPAEQIMMLYDGAIKFIMQSKTAIDNKDIEARCNATQRAIKIVSYLMGILNDEKGGDLSKNLYKVYGHVIALLVQIGIQNSHEPADQALEHLKTLRASWQKIAKPTADTPAATAEDTPGKSDALSQKRSAIA